VDLARTAASTEGGGGRITLAVKGVLCAEILRDEGMQDGVGVGFEVWHWWRMEEDQGGHVTYEAVVKRVVLTGQQSQEAWWVVFGMVQVKYGVSSTYAACMRVATWYRQIAVGGSSKTMLEVSM